MAQSPLKVAIVGLGYWGQHLLRVLDPRCRVVYGCTRSPSVKYADVLCRHPALLYSSDIQFVLASKAIDAVVIATPNETHAELAEAALHAGKHVFVEKPMTMDVEKAERLVRLADDLKKTLFVGHTFIHDPVLVRLRKMAEEDKIEYLKFSNRKFGTFDSNILWNLTCHHVSTALKLFRRVPSEVSVLHKRGLLTDMDVLITRMLFNDVECISEIDRCSYETRGTAVIVFKKRGVVSWDGSYLSAPSKSGKEEMIADESSKETLAFEAEAFISACETGKPSETSGYHGLDVVRTLSRFNLPK